MAFRKELGLELAFLPIWKRLASQPEGLDCLRHAYGGVQKYYTEGMFDVNMRREDCNLWMLANPLRSAKNKERVLAVWRSILSGSPQPAKRGWIASMLGKPAHQAAWRPDK